MMILIGLTCGCGPDNAKRRSLTVVVSGDVHGRIVPCGCTSNQSGGLPRRASYLESLADDEVIVVDAGGAPAGTSAHDRLKFEAILRGEIAMNVAAHNVGASEAALGPDCLRDLARRLDVPWVSANVFDRTGRPVAEPVRLVEAAGRRVALIGVLDPQYATDALDVRPPREAVLGVLRALDPPADAAIVLAYLPDAELRTLAETLPEVDAVVGGPTGQPIPPQRTGATLLASATGDGKFVARLDAPAADGAQGWSGRIVELDEQFTDEPGQVDNVQQYYAELRRRDLRPSDTSLVEPMPAGIPEDYRVAGSASCRECHLEDDRVWRDSRHHAAWSSLSNKGAEVDPDCQRCHVTGYGLPGGFVSMVESPRRFGVGCEDCHGPSQTHVDDPEHRKTMFDTSAAGQCVVCHDQENSPHFDYKTYWPKIKHGEAAAKKPAAPSTSK